MTWSSLAPISVNRVCRLRGRHVNSTVFTRRGRVEIITRHSSRRLLRNRNEVSQRNFAFCVIASCSVAFFYPTTILWFQPELVTPALAVSMLAMGCTLTVDDFTILAQHPLRIAIGVMLQYTIMPMTGFFISRRMQLPASVSAGVVLVACCPGGVASNIVTYLAGGDVALSVAMTAVSTLLGIGLTPFLTSRLIGALVPVDGWALFLSTLQVILMPIMLGVGLKSLFPEAMTRLQKLAPLIAVVAVNLINASITARNAGTIAQSGLLLFVAVATLHTTGFALGYLCSGILGMPHRCRATVSIEVGMQNSGLASVLAMKHFGDPLTICTCVVSACFHSVTGGIVAWICQKVPRQHP